jgi:RNAse (barnase) inhibitor barstar
LKTYVIDGRNFSTLEGFYDEVSRVLIPGAAWGHNLDAFDDILCGGFGTPEEGFKLRWLNHGLSQERLGYEETVRQLELRLGGAHASNLPDIREKIIAAQVGDGPTVYDWLVEIILRYAPEAERGFGCGPVELTLE